MTMKPLHGRLRVAEGTCPAGHSLMTDEKFFDGQRAVKAKLRVNGVSGYIFFNPFYGRAEYETDVPLNPGDVVEIFCPTCGTSLAIDEMCHICQISMFAVHLPDGGQVEVCLRVGCHNHALKIVDLDAQLARMYVDETKVQM